MDIKKLAIIHCWPSSLNYDINQYNLNNVANDLAQYDMVQLAPGLQNNNHQDHDNTKTILGKNAVQNVDFYGYINTIDSLSCNQTKINNWKNMGDRIIGIMCDNFGSVSRSKQNCLVDYIHGQGLKTMVKSSSVSNVFDGSPSHKLNSTDWFLYESYQIINGNYETKTNWRNKSDSLSSQNINVACVTTYDSSAFNQNKLDYAYLSCVLDLFDAFGWGEENYSANTSLMPYRTRPNIYGTEFTSSIINNGDIFERQTNIGVHVDTNSHTVDYLLD